MSMVGDRVVVGGPWRGCVFCGIGFGFGLEIRL